MTTSLSSRVLTYYSNSQQSTRRTRHRVNEALLLTLAESLTAPATTYSSKYDPQVAASTKSSSLVTVTDFVTDSSGLTSGHHDLDSEGSVAWMNFLDESSREWLAGGHSGS
jgi:hypothetical protein